MSAWNVLIKCSVSRAVSSQCGSSPMICLLSRNDWPITEEVSLCRKSRFDRFIEIHLHDIYSDGRGFD